MTDRKDTRRLYRGGGREGHRRWNRDDQYRASERRDDRPAGGDRHGSGPTGRSEAGGPPGEPARRYGSRGRGPTGEPGRERISTGGRAGGDTTEPPRNRAPADGHGIPAGEYGQSDRRRGTDEDAGVDRRAGAAGGSYRQPYGQPAGRRPTEGEGDDRFLQRRSRRERPRRSRTAGGNVERESAKSSRGDSGGGRRDQPRDPETGRFVSKDEADDRGK